MGTSSKKAFLTTASVFAVLLLCVSCGGPIDDDTELTAMLTALGVDTDPDDRVDSNGNAIDANTNPLGSPRTVLRKDSEIFFTGAYVSGDDAEATAVFAAYDGSSGYASTGTDDDYSWTQFFNKSTAADVDGDGYDEVVAVYYDTNDGTVVLRQLAYDAGTYETVATYPLTVSSTDDFTYRQCIAAGDIDADGNDEIIVTNSTTFLVYDHDYTQLLATTVDSQNGTEEDAILRVTCADFDGDGYAEIVFVDGVMDDDYTAHVTIYSYGTGTLAAVEDFDMNAGERRLESAAVACGDLDGDQIPELAFAGNRTDSGECALMVADVSMDADSNCVFEMLSTYDDDGENDERILTVACGDIDGDGYDEVVWWDEICRLTYDEEGGTWELQECYGNNAISSCHTDMLAVGDVNGDEQPDIVLFSENREDLHVYSVNDSGDLEGGELIDTEGRHDNGSLCLPDLDRDSAVLEYSTHELKFTDPRIVAVITSPPYWSTVDQNLANTSLTFGNTDSTETETSTSYGFSVSVSFGNSVEAPIFGRLAGSAEIKNTIESSFTWGFSNSKEITVTRGYAAGAGEDKVVFSCIPFDVYYYTIVSSPDPTEIGELTCINVPRTPVVLSQSAEYYNANNGGGQDIDSTVVASTPGDPFSYPDMEDRDSIRAANDGEGLYTYESEHVMAVGQGVGHTTLSIEEITTEQSSFNYELNISREIEVVAGGILVGAGLSFDFDYGYSNSVSSGTYVAVSIGDINEVDYADYIYKYGLMAYPKTAGSTEDDTYQAFTMVTCWVEPVSAD